MASEVFARAFWTVGPGLGEIRKELLPQPNTNQVLIRTLATGISRGSESIVFAGQVPPSEFQRMRAPFQAGEFPYPVKYGYANVGLIEQGPERLLGKRVFCLFPHQDRYVVDFSQVVLVPEQVPTPRACLTANMETAINVLWDAAPRVGDRIAVVGGGVIGFLCAHLLAAIPGVKVQVAEINKHRWPIAQELNLEICEPEQAVQECDRVIHCSGTAEGLRTALLLAGFEAKVIEVSWFGAQVINIPLGEAFHAKRLIIQASQVSAIAKVNRDRWTHQERLQLALALLADSRLDALVRSSWHFHQLPEVMPRICQKTVDDLCPVVDYS